MKTEQEQIEEIAFSSCVVPHNTIQFLSNYMQKESIKFESCRVCEFYNSCQRIKDIKNLYKAGYRKASDVIDEFVERLKEENEISFRRYGKGIELSKQSCLSWNELRKYVGQGLKDFYGWHIIDPKLYDKPRELGEFRKVCLNGKCSDCIYEECKITRPPQSWCYVDELQ